MMGLIWQRLGAAVMYLIALAQLLAPTVSS
jgi:hypothetical protein